MTQEIVDQINERIGELGLLATPENADLIDKWLSHPGSVLVTTPGSKAAGIWLETASVKTVLEAQKIL